MKQWKIWIPLIGILFFTLNTFKNKTILMYVTEFILWVLYQTIVIIIIKTLIQMRC